MCCSSAPPRPSLGEPEGEEPVIKRGQVTPASCKSRFIRVKSAFQPHPATVIIAALAALSLLKFCPTSQICQFDSQKAPGDTAAAALTSSHTPKRGRERGDGSLAESFLQTGMGAGVVQLQVMTCTHAILDHLGALDRPDVVLMSTCWLQRSQTIWRRSGEDVI